MKAECIWHLSIVNLCVVFASVFPILMHCLFLTVEDLVVYYYDRNISTIDLLRRLNMSYARFDVKDIKCDLSEYSCKAVCPLENEDQQRMNRKDCYCDKLCVELGDCCFDYFLWLVNKLSFR